MTNNILPIPPSVTTMKLGGLQVVRSPLVPRSPKFAARDIRLKDGTRLLSPEFLARENRWWRERFGDVDVAYRSDNTVFVSPQTYEKLRRHIDAEVERTIYGESPTKEPPTGLLTTESMKASSVTRGTLLDGYLRHMRTLLQYSGRFPPVA